MTVPSDPPASVTPAAFKTWTQDVSDTAQDHDTRIGSLEGGGGGDHGLLTGLADDDHTIYALADGSRGSFATTAQGATADSALQPADIGSTVQGHDADLDTIAALDSATAGALATDGAGWIRKTYAQLKTALGLVKADVGLGNVDNTADADKEVSTAQQAALDAKAPLASPTFTGTPAAPTATAGTDTTQVATTAFVADATSAPVPVTEAADFTVGATHSQTVVRCTKATLQSVTIPTDATNDLPDGYETVLFAEGAGGLTLVTTGITLIGSSPNTTIAQNEGLFLKKTATANTWLCLGGTAA